MQCGQMTKPQWQALSAVACIICVINYCASKYLLLFMMFDDSNKCLLGAKQMLVPHRGLDVHRTVGRLEKQAQLGSLTSRVGLGKGTLASPGELLPPSFLQGHISTLTVCRPESPHRHCFTRTRYPNCHRMMGDHSRNLWPQSHVDLLKPASVKQML